MPNWKKVITSGSDAALNSLAVTTSLTSSGDFKLDGAFYDNNNTLGTSGQMLQSTGTGIIWTDNIAEQARDLVIQGKNMTLSTIEKGTPLYFSASGTAGNVVGVYPADAGNPARMPAGGIAGEQLTAGTEGDVYIYGFINGVDTSAFNSGDSVFVGVGGGYTNIKPTGSALIQKLGNVERSDVSNGSGVIQGPSWYNDLPNIQENYVWLGDSNGVPQAVVSSSLLVDTASLALNVEYNNVLNKPTLLSSSAQIASDISGSFLLNTTDTLDGDLTVTGKLTAREFHTEFVSSSIIYESGSTKFGDTVDDTHEFTGSLDVTGTINATSFTGSIGIGDSDTLGIGSQIFHPQGTNGFSVNEDFDPSNSSLQTAYHFTSGVGRETVAFTLARTGQFTDGFGIYGTAADNTFVMFGEQNNTSFEWRRGIGIRPLDLDGGTLLARLNTAGQFSANSISASNGITGSLLGTATSALAVEFTNILNKPALLSGSAQIAEDISGSFLLNTTDTLDGDLTVTGNLIVDSDTVYTSGSRVGINTTSPVEALTVEGNISASGNINIDGDISADTISGSFTGEGSGITGIISSSYAVTASYVEYDNVANKPTLISSSLQFNDLTSPFTGSFTGSFTGDGSGLTNLPEFNSVTASFSSTSSVTVNHNFDSKNISVSVYDNSDILLIPDQVTLVDSNNVKVDFAGSTSGFVVVNKGGHILSGSFEFSNILNKPTLLSSSAQIAEDISGSFLLNTTDTLDGDLTVTGDLNIDGGKITIDTTAIVGREDILLSTVSDNTDDKFGIANGTTTSNRFIPTFYGYTNGAYQSMIFRGLGSSTHDLVTSPSMVEFLVANTNSTSDPNNGTLTAITNRPVFNFGTTGYSYMRILPSGNVGIGNNTSPQATLDVTGNAIISGNLTVDTNTLFVDSANNRVGIGTSSPSSKLEVNSGLDNIVAKFISTDAGSWIQFNDNDILGYYLGTTSSSFVIRDTNNAERMRIDSSGNVGIGTTSPSHLLEVKSSGSSAETVASFGNANIANGLQVQTNGNLEWGFNALNSRNLTFSTNQTERMRITSTGNVGIGTSSPSAKLHIVTATGVNFQDAIYLSKAGGFGDSIIQNYYNNVPHYGIAFEVGGVKGLHQNSSGNVGIGTSSPATKLFVSDTDCSIVAAASNTGGFAQLSLKPIGSDGSSVGDAVIKGIPEGSDQATAMTFTLRQSGGTRTERMRIDSSGNVGIGTSSPSANLHIAGTSSPVLTLEGDSTGTCIVQFADNDINVGQIRYSHPSNQMDFRVNDATRMSIDSSGNVGIGTSSPSAKLEVAGNAVINTALASSGLNGLFISGTSNSFIAFRATESLSSDGANIAIDNANLKFITRTSGTNTERMRIDSSGNLLVGTTSNDPRNFSGGTYGVKINQSQSEFAQTTMFINRAVATDGDVVAFRRNGASVGSISVTSTNTSYNTSSDYRLKENVVEMTGALDRVDALKPSRFNFINDAEKTVDGFLAHEVQDIVPEAVTGEKDAVDEEGNPIYQGIDQSKLVPLLVGAVKELKAKNDELEARLAKLEALI